jgi:hypothetical protein
MVNFRGASEGPQAACDNENAGGRNAQKGQGTSGSGIHVRTGQVSSALKRGMDAANELEIDELRRMTIAEKARQIGIQMGGAKSFGWAEKLREGEDEVRALWVELKRRHAAQK